MTDLDADGVVTFAGAIGSNFLINSTTGFSKPAIGGGSQGDQIDLLSFNAASQGPGTLRLLLEDPGFSPVALAPHILKGTVGGTLTAPSGSTITVQSWVNTNNAVPGYGLDQGLPASSLVAVVPEGAGSVAVWPPLGVTFGPGAFSGTATAPFNPTGLFSLFLQVDVSFAGPGNVSFNENQQAFVPEPASALVWLGLCGIGVLACWWRRRG